MSAPRVPVTLLTGFLGSGKTTLFARLLKAPEAGRIAAIVNEFGDVDLDHDLLEASSEDIVVLGNGCLCCSMRGNLAETLRSLAARRDQDARFAFDRVVIETSGLVDPVPVLRLLLGDPWIGDRFAVAGVVAVVDAVNGERTLARHPEAVAQVQVADPLVITKTDLVEADSVRALEAHLATLNPQARRLRAVRGELDAGVILAPEQCTVDTAEAPGAFAETGADRAEGAQQEPCEGTAPQTLEGARALPAEQTPESRHTDEVRSFSLRFGQPLTTDQFERLLAILRRMTGPGLLRAKGIVRLQGEPAPLAVHAVQDVLHPPEALPSAAAVPSRLVVIGRGLDSAEIAAMRALE